MSERGHEIVENCGHPTGNNGVEYGACAQCITGAMTALLEQAAQIAESWTPDQWEIHPREDFARKEIAAAIRRA